MKNSWTGGEAARAIESPEENLAVAVHRLEPGAFERFIDARALPDIDAAKRLRDLERGLTEEKVFAFLLSQSTVEQP